MRIAVLGAGANGAGIGSDLARAGLDVTFIEQWPTHVSAMRKDGLRVVMPDRETVTTVSVLDLCDVASLRAPFDLVLMLVKAYDTAWASRLIEPVLAHDGVLIGVQNGMTAQTIAEVVGVERTLGCVIEVSSELRTPGIVHRHTPPEQSWFALGPLGATSHPRLDAAAEVLRHAGTVAVVEDILAAKWMKLVSNTSTLVPTAILGLPMVAAMESPGMRDLMIRAGNETFALGLALGYGALPIFGLSEDDLSQPERIVEVFLDALYAGFVLPNTTTTVLHDWQKGRRSEAMELNGLVSRQARSLGLTSPANDALTETARRIERGDLRPEPSNRRALIHLASA